MMDIIKAYCTVINIIDINTREDNIKHGCVRNWNGFIRFFAGCPDGLLNTQ
jgi:hypothetical protein